MKRAGSYYKLLYHYTWATRDRLPLITSTVEGRLFPYLQAKCNELGYKLHALNGTEDHVHLLLELTPSVLVADVAKNLKGASSHYINKESGLPDTLYWQDGYGVVSLREGDAPAVAAYIDRQKEHHGAGKLSQVLEKSSE
jgi:REP element-mobilizing transposase RayT